jgi:hypothetical protein
MKVKRVAVALLMASSLAWVPASARGEDCGPPPAAVVAKVLHLLPEQVQVFGQLLGARQAALTPILLQIAVREQRIKELVTTGGNPAEIGVLMLQVHQLQQQAAAVQAQFLNGFAGLLTEEQRGQWEQLRAAARLQPVLPAFQALNIL